MLTRVRPLLLLALGVACALRGWPASAQAPSPTIDDLLNLKRVASPMISPDGRLVAYTLRETNWDENEYETEIWVGDGSRVWQLTNGLKSSTQPAWSPDGKWIAFISDRARTRQLYRIAIEGGEAERLITTDQDITAFAWAADGGRIAFTMIDPISESMKAREKQYGDFRIEDEDRRYTHLYVLDLATRERRQLTSGAFVVGAFDWSPDGRQIAFDHRVSSDAADNGTADISVVSVDGGVPRAVVSQDGPDTNPRWSPDGSRIAFTSAMAKPDFYYRNRELAVVRPGETGIQRLTASFDEDPSLVDWTASGIYFTASQRTWAYMFRIDPESRAITRVALEGEWIGTSFSVTPDGKSFAFVGAGPGDFPDVYAGTVANASKPARITRTADQTASWPRHTREVVRWKSQDGTTIEGVLHKPADFQAGRRYPLLVVIHGGPTGVSRPMPYTNYVGYYPIDLWLSRGALVLEPNYRGSAGYGESFRSLNVRNLGVGDAWDVLSGIDKLVADGLADPARVGAMGWSQGGYISAFLTTKHAERFKAVSVGAGISNWMTYYVNTDIHPFTRQYLKATPWDDPKIYAVTSPMTYIAQARTPTLIQHGDQDQRVPIPNAFELYQGLRDRNVPTQLIVFKGFGHPLNKPKANRAAMQQNYDWFDKYLWSTTGVTP
jgi:dipeptidyl aminopeptidase/acylaminoacyl peptidase